MRDRRKQHQARMPGPIVRIEMLPQILSEVLLELLHPRRTAEGLVEPQYARITPA